ncbi:hypothetical protein D3C71_1556220 [compost metagenome]
MRQAVAQGQVFDARRHPFTRQIFGRRAHHRAADGQFAGDQVGIQVIGDPHRQVHPLFHQIDGALDQHQVHGGAGVLLDVIGDHAGQMP